MASWVPDSQSPRRLSRVFPVALLFLFVVVLTAGLLVLAAVEGR